MVNTTSIDTIIHILIIMMIMILTITTQLIVLSIIMMVLLLILIILIFSTCPSRSDRESRRCPRGHMPSTADLILGIYFLYEFFILALYYLSSYCCISLLQTCFFSLYISFYLVSDFFIFFLITYLYFQTHHTLYGDLAITSRSVISKNP